MKRHSLKKDNSNKISEQNLKQIFDKLPDPIFVTDPGGNVLLSNSTTALTMDMSLDQLLKSNVCDLVRNGYYNKSHIMEAVEKKRVVSGILTTKLNINQFSTSTPILDEKGNVVLVVTTGKALSSAEKNITPDEREYLNRRKREVEYLRSYVLDTDTIVAESNSMRALLLKAHNIAQTDSTVLVCGESGTGKELLAKYLHRHSKRANEAFIAVNCANFPEHLVESELFGYEKGAFTGANAEGKIGLFEAAHRGTLFLDEIAELPLPLQSKLLRVLETHEVRRLGSYVDRKLDLRLIAATNKDLEKMAESGSFRADLYYRLNVIPLQIPPLRERPEDIVALSLKFFETFKNKYGAEIRLSSDNLEYFQKYSWPGNVRELRNVVERLIINSLQNYPSEQVAFEKNISEVSVQSDCFELMGLSGTLKEVMDALEEKYIRQTLLQCGGKLGETANKLGIHRTILYRKLKSFEQQKET